MVIGARLFEIYGSPPSRFRAKNSWLSFSRCYNSCFLNGVSIVLSVSYPWLDTIQLYYEFLKGLFYEEWEWTIIVIKSTNSYTKVQKSYLEKAKKKEESAKISKIETFSELHKKKGKKRGIAIRSTGWDEFPLSVGSPSKF